MRHISPRVLTASAVSVSALLLAGCGSTVPVSSQVAANSGLDDGLGVPSAVDVPSSSSSTASTTTQASGSTSLGSVSGSGGGSGTSPLGPSTHTQSPSSTPSKGPVAGGTALPTSLPSIAKTTGPVKVGYFVLQDTGAAFKALGYGGLSSGNGKAQVQAAVKMVNAKGGVGGRQITPVIFEASATNNLSDTVNQACSTFFDDNKVEAVVSMMYDDLLSQCTKKHNVPLIADSTKTTSAANIASNPLLVLPNHLTVEDAARALAEGVVRTGWVSAAKKPVIGLITFDVPAYSKVKPIVEGVLAKAGLSVKAVEYMPFDGISQATAAGKAAALKFQSAGVNHVLGLDTGFGMSWFTLSAGGQGYYPALGMTSLSLPGAFPQLFNDKQLNGSTVIGWAPALDTIPSKQPLVSGRTTLCLNAMKSAKEDMSLSLSRTQSELLCDGTWFLADTFRTGTISGAALQAGLSALTGGFQSSIAFKADPRRNRAAAAAYRGAAYATSCKCYVYSGPLYSVG